MRAIRKVYAAHIECDVAQRELSIIRDDPMTEEYGMIGEVSDGWLMKHCKTCDLCMKATMEASMP